MSSTTAPVRQIQQTPARRWLTLPGLSLWLSLGFAVAALVIGLNTPQRIPLSFLEEGGPVELATVWLYLAAVPVVLLLRLPALSKLDKVALSIILLACAAREADLHKALFGMSILKLRFYNQFASGWQIAVAVLVLLPIVASVVWVAWRHGPRLLTAPSTWSVPLATIVVFLAEMAVAKTLDRLPDTLLALHLLPDVPQVLRQLLISEEEILELSLPLLAVLAAVQGRLSVRRG